jgi:hypothetical protein
MKWKERVVEEFEEFVDAIRDLAPKKLDHGEEYWFRGQCNESWCLRTAFMRSCCKLDMSHDQLTGLEDTALRAFKWSAHLHVRPELLEKVKTTPCWWALMQQHGAPTRLLDWTASPYVAAYFAVLQDEDGSDGAVWFFCSTKLREDYTKRVGESMPDFEERDACKWTKLIEERRREKIVVPLSFSLASSERIVAQQGKFTMSFDIREEHDSIMMSHNDGSDLQRLVIPHKSKPKYLLRLRSMNITGASLFPGVDGLGMAMKELVSLGNLHKKTACPVVRKYVDGASPINDA